MLMPRGMSTMSRKATMEYIGQKRRLYLAKDRAGKSRMLDEVCETCGFDRKYAGKLLTGNRIYKEPKGRGKHYSKRGSALLKRVWRASGSSFRGKDSQRDTTCSPRRQDGRCGKTAFQNGSANP